ncbi:MAG: hypothetical protein EA385_03095 [Salinarimonadaceae bacterium]|nr:MAG: hypothetical protein EA385_17140 [Salinarimonadaceae bacterium]TVR10687.1 MAG: hypothetical protein EA385_03095 [Salinarimonadaceae bacterium]
MVKRFLLAAGLAFALAACDGQNLASSNRHLQPIPPQTLALMERNGMSPSDPILVRIFKKEAELEVWKKGRDGRYAMLKTYPICRWSGQLGPKRREGDRQAPEGFYTVTPDLMNPNSAYYLSFNMGYPNQFDRQHGRTGSHLMVHGSCSSAGCYAMTDEAIAEVYAIAREAFAGGQRGFQVQAYPFRMTPENLAKVRYDENIAFWRNLKEGYDHFEIARTEPSYEVCGRRYAFNSQNCSPVDQQLAAAVRAKNAQDEIRIAELVKKGAPAVRIVYDDGGSHETFRQYAVALGNAENPNQVSSRARRLGMVSRPDAIVAGRREIPVDSSGRPTETAVAAAPAPVSAPAAGQQPAASPGVTSVARASASEERPLHQRLFGDLFSLNLFGGSSRSETSPTPAAAETSQPRPPRRGDAGSDRRVDLMPGAYPIAPDQAVGYTSFR